MTDGQGVLPDDAVFVEVGVGEGITQVELEVFVSEFDVGLESFGLEIAGMVL